MSGRILVDRRRAIVAGLGAGLAVGLALPLLAGFVLAPLFGGRWSRLAQLRVRGVWVFYAAIALQLIAFPVKVIPWHTSDQIGVVLWLISYGIFSLGIAINARMPGIPFIAVGLVSNLSAILANGGHMPALPSALRGAGLHFVQSRNSARMASPHLAWLVDRWAAPGWMPWSNVFSVGDVFIAGGGLLFALGATGALRMPSRLATFWTDAVRRIRRREGSAELRLQFIADTLEALDLRLRRIEEQLQRRPLAPRALDTHVAPDDDGPEAEKPQQPRESVAPVVTPIRRRRSVLEQEAGALGHVCLVPTQGGYALLERPGAAPTAGSVVDLGDGSWGEVAKVARSPLPNDKRRCAYLVRAEGVAAAEDDMPGLRLVSGGS